jgi:Uma2 family endonuclease
MALLYIQTYPEVHKSLQTVTNARSHIVSLKTRATIEDLYKVEGKAELVNGEIVEMPPSGDEPSSAGFEIATSLKTYARRSGRGRAYPDGTGFHVNLPHRESFSPDAAYHIGSRTGMRFLEGSPIFAVEVRSENDYGPAAERAMQDKRADYFACGTLVVWDVDLLSEDVIKSYKASDPEHPLIFRRGDIADAEPAVPGWRLAVTDLFE